AAVGAEGDGEDRSRLNNWKTADRFAGRRVPDLKFALARVSPGPAGRYQVPAVWTVSDLVDHLRQARFSPAQSSRCGLVNLDNRLHSWDEGVGTGVSARRPGVSVR